MIFQEVSWIRSNSHKFCPSLRRQALEWYRPVRFVPCFFQKYFKAFRQRFRKVPVIVQMHPSDPPHADALDFHSMAHTTARSAGCYIRRSLHSIHGFSTKVNAGTLEKLTKDQSVRKIWYDGEVKAVLDKAIPAVRAPQAWEKEITGKEIGVAVIDTGVHPHPDLSGRITAFQDLVNDRLLAYDDNGHGTHVAGCIASSGSIYRGVAPGAKIIGVKVLNKLGSGALSTVIEGVQWCIDNKDSLGIKVINLSLGSPAGEGYQEDPVCHAVEKAWSSGIIVCAAAGNDGPGARTISSPGIHPDIITVGAADDKNSEYFGDYEIADFSGRGPTVDGLSKPDVVCPGCDIISLRSPGSLIDKQNKEARVGKEYFNLSGTSMATPICAGIAALILEADKALTPYGVKTILKQTARPLPGVTDENLQGKGMAVARSAVHKALSMYQKESKPTSSNG